MNQKGFVKIILVVIIVIFAGAVAYWYWGDEVRLQLVTRDWKTYRNEKYGFEVKYPKNLTLKEAENKTSAFLYLLPEELRPPLVFVKVMTSDEHKLYSRWLPAPYRLDIAFVDTAEIIFSENIVINNIDFKKDYQVVYLGGLSKDVDTTNYVIYADTEMNNKYYTLGLELWEPKIITSEKALNELRDDKNEYVKIYNQMLSTFKFID